ncbi:MAG: sensor histidine kinase [Flavobacteriaceae bacterium]
MSSAIAADPAQGGSRDPRAGTGAASPSRKHLQREVKTARAKLTSQTGIAPEFDSELLQTYARNQLSVALVVPLLAIAIAVAASAWSPTTQAALWLLAALTGNTVMLVIARSFMRHVHAMKLRELKAWSLRFTAVEFLNGVLFGSFAFVPRDNGENSALIFVFAAALLFLAMRTVLSSNRPLAMLVATLPISIAATFKFCLVGGVLNYSMAGFMLGAQGFFTILAYQLHHTLIEMLGLRAEKDALIGELEQSKSISDEARRRAEQANLAKSQFLATMSHELRTPLNAILGFSEVMKDEIIGKHGIPAYKEYSSDIHRSGQHLLQLINEILDLSRIEAGRYELSEEPVSLSSTVADCHHLLKLMAKERGVSVVEDIEPRLPKLWADERAVRQIVLNLITNAIKFTPNGGMVTLTVGWTQNGGQYFTVRDTGPGIPEDEIPIVKQSFGRGSHALKNAEEGSGLGLPIVISLVELHGGRFDLQSKLREGTAVTVIFPKERVMKALPPIPDADSRAA